MDEAPPAKYHSFFLVATPMKHTKNGGVASILPLTTDSASISGIESHVPVLEGGEEAAYSKALEALRGNEALSGLEMDEQRE